ncbi:MAG: lipocalin family protein [Campylobacterota bacterium]|nr:lipocalin family protein [Campylobacterota bacterium]
MRFDIKGYEEYAIKFSPIFITSIAVILTLLSACSSTPQQPPATVASVDLQRYSGLWYEIARYENRFEAGCVGVMAHYTFQGETMAVSNSCYDASGRLKAQVKGKAKVIKESNGSKLEVSFSWLSGGDYWILMLADDYRYSVVGDPEGEYLWILSRDTVLTDDDKKTILSKISALGYAPDKLYWTGFKAACNAKSMR